jgi:hypothetical protein
MLALRWGGRIAMSKKRRHKTKKRQDELALLYPKTAYQAN